MVAPCDVCRGAAIAAGKATIPYRIKGQPVTGMTKMKYKIADKIVLSKLRAALGFDRAVALLSGSAPLDAEVQSFFLAMGLDLLEGYERAVATGLHNAPVSVMKNDVVFATGVVPRKPMKMP